MSVRCLAILAAATSLASACNLVKLSDDIAQAHCDSDADCKVLNEREGDAFDVCEPWQCVAKTRYCEKGPLDADRDGFSPASVMRDGAEEMCVAEVSKQDCDDRDDARAPELDETCDDKDNDCDGDTDEGALDSEVETLVALGAAPVAASYALDTGSGMVAIGFATDETNGKVPGVAFVAEGLHESATPMRFAGVPFAPRVGVAPLDSGRFAVAIYATTGKKRLVAGVVAASGTGGSIADPAADASGLACAADESCASDPDGPTPGTGGIGLAAVGDHVLVVAARASGDDIACSGPDTPGPVVANLLIHRRGKLEELTPSAFALAVTTNDPTSNPVVLGLGALAPEAGWLVGYANDMGDLRFDHVTRDGDTLAVEREWLIVPGEGSPLSNPAAWLAVSSDPNMGLVGLAYRRGCPESGDARVLLRFIEVSVEGTMLTAKLSGDPLRVGETTSESDPAVAFNESRKSWLVTWRDAGGLRGRVLEWWDGVLGDAPYTLVEQRGGTGASLSTAAVPLSGAWFGALAAVSRDGAFGFDVARLGVCAR